MQTPSDAILTQVLKKNEVCRDCGVIFKQGETIQWSPSLQIGTCLTCRCPKDSAQLKALW